MKKLKYIVLFVLINQIGFSQNELIKTQLIKLAEVYKEYHVADPTDEVFIKLDSINVDVLSHSKLFISELIKENNRITDSMYLVKPDSLTIRYLHVIRGLTWNMFNKEYHNTNLKEFGIDSLMNQKVDYKEQFANYYSMMWTSVLNKNRPFDMSSVNFSLDNYNFNYDEKAIFFLESMETLGTLISGYFHVDPPNIERANEFVSKYPSFNNKEHYNFDQIEFEDFDFTYSSKKPKGSYKEYQLNKYLNTILSHAICLSEDPENENEVKNIIQNSIMADKRNWKYSKTPEVFEQIYGN